MNEDTFNGRKLRAPTLSDYDRVGYVNPYTRTEDVNEETDLFDIFEKANR